MYPLKVTKIHALSFKYQFTLETKGGGRIKSKIVYLRQKIWKLGSYMHRDEHSRESWFVMCFMSIWHISVVKTTKENICLRDQSLGLKFLGNATT